MSLELVLAALLLPGVAAASPKASLREPAIEVQADGTALSVEVEGRVPLAEVLQAVGHATGATVIIRRETGLVGPIHIERQPAGAALRELAGRNHIAIDYWNLEDPAFDYDTMLAGTLRRIVLMGQAAEPLVSEAPVMRTEPAAGPEPEFTEELPETPRTPSAQASAARAHQAALDQIASMGERREPGDLDELRAVIDNNADPNLRRAAITALARSGDDSGLAIISEAGLSNDDAGVRLFAAKTLWRLGGQEMRPRLITAAAVETDAQVRDGIEQLLGRVN
jgi:hypothetical protein